VLCKARRKENNLFSDVDAFSGQLINFIIVKSSTSKSSETCFTARAVPTKKIDEHTWFEIKSDPKGKKTTKTCGDPKKFVAMKEANGKHLKLMKLLQKRGKTPSS